eukprot:TRINITY_DN6431_c0_g1_i2.p2 TRINITY_DN6431_c0_g1~~TRINITY_DN6431_c0_g1_i2.p2  ORF type:complete len:200 (+),score=-20.81 TRINITY_DN6431_c0_g1_i2:611-1210(+)
MLCKYIHALVHQNMFFRLHMLIFTHRNDNIFIVQGQKIKSSINFAYEQHNTNFTARQNFYIFTQQFILFVIHALARQNQKKHIHANIYMHQHVKIKKKQQTMPYVNIFIIVLYQVSDRTQMGLFGVPTIKTEKISLNAKILKRGRRGFQTSTSKGAHIKSCNQQILFSFIQVSQAIANNKFLTTVLFVILCIKPIASDS